MAADAPPWTIFPKPPCRTADAFFRLCGGMTQEQTPLSWRRAATPIWRYGYAISDTESAISTADPTDGGREEPAWATVSQTNNGLSRDRTKRSI